MSDEVRDRESGVAAATVNEKQKLATREEQITKPAPKVKPQREKDPKKVAAGKKLAEKNRQAKAALEREVKREREIAEKEQQDENSAGWLPEMSFQNVLPIVGVAFSAFEMYKRFRPKSSSGSAQSPISSREEPKQSDSGAGESQAPSGEETGKNLRNVEERRPEQRDDERSALSSKIGMVWAKRSGAPSADQRSIIINLFSPSKNVRTK